MKRETATHVTDSANRRPRLALKVISEKKWLHFIKESLFEDIDTIPTGKLEYPTIVVYRNGDKYVGEVEDGLPNGQGTIASIECPICDKTAHDNKKRAT
jgi:hypothetical protein